MNLSEILGRLKSDQKGKKGYGTPPNLQNFLLS